MPCDALCQASHWNPVDGVEQPLPRGCMCGEKVLGPRPGSQLVTCPGFGTYIVASISLVQSRVEDDMQPDSCDFILGTMWFSMQNPF